MPFPPPRDHKIPLDAAAAMTRRYRESAGPGRERAGLFPRSALEAILNQPGVMGIRIYFGTHADGTMGLVLVGVDDEGNDMTQGELMDWNFPCPPFCTETGPLNG